jgi:hypothetical protein
LSIAALGMAVAYLLIIVAGGIGALVVTIWLFGETPDATTSTKRETVKDLQNGSSSRVESTSSAPVMSERSEDKAA